MSVASESPESLLSPVWPHLTAIIADRAQGACIYDQHGARHLDFTCGIGVTNTGHCHPRVVQAVQVQAARLLHGQLNIVLHPPALALVQALRGIVPPTLDSFFFANSGAEASETVARGGPTRSN